MAVAPFKGSFILSLTPLELCRHICKLSVDLPIFKKKPEIHNFRWKSFFLKISFQFKKPQCYISQLAFRPLVAGFQLCHKWLEWSGFELES